MRLAFAVLLFLPALQAQTHPPAEIRSAAERSIATIQKGAEGFSKAVVCFSCHNHAMPLLTFQAARERGISVNEALAKELVGDGFKKSPDFTSIDQAVQDPMIIDPAVSDGWALISAHAAGVRPNLVTAVYARRIANWQKADGHWPTFDSRPPQSYSLFAATAVALRAIQIAAPSQLHQEVAERQSRAKNWLLGAKPRDTEDFIYRLFGLHYAGATSEECARAARELLALQRADGGWAQLPHLQPDAYSTGAALVALHVGGGVPVTDPAWQKGIRSLLSTQDEKGVWRVPTRQVSPAPISPAYVDAGFPYGHDQFISMDAACWAAMAFMLTLPRSAQPAAPQPVTELEPKGLKPWMETALFGTAAELRALLDSGLDPNVSTPEGTTLLMMAAMDPEKVKLLIDRGADVRAKAKTGFTALMIASTYTGTAASVRLLLDNGAEVNSGKDVVFNASPLFLASFAGDKEILAMLLAKGADPHRAMNLLGMSPILPVNCAVSMGNAGTVKTLLAAGVDVNVKDADSMTPLHWSVIAHHGDIANILLNAGAKVDAIDRFGFTPLLYATTLDFGDAETAELLLQAGANPGTKDAKGATPLKHARDIPYLKAALEKAGAKE